MSGLNKAEIRVGTLNQENVIGAALFGDLTAQVPTMTNMLVTDGYIGMGYMPEDGFAVAVGQTATGIKEHNLGVVRMIDNGDEKSISLTLMQTNADNMAIMLGDDHVESEPSNGTHGNRVKAGFGHWTGKEGRLQVLLKDGDAYGVWCIPVSQVAEVSEVEVNATGVMGWQIKFTAMDNPDGDDLYLITDDGIVSA